ncbi:hypothetical protein B0J14DRAFT_651165 [Halenospora varia]|nr:hypothetical protein B0J14DRAFT_651165 [Halenospora varia]
MRCQVSFDIKRLQNFRKSIQLEDNELERSFKELDDLLSWRAARVNKVIAQTSIKIAYENKRDSSAMKTLAVLALVFLPGTFVATLHSSPFFDFKPLALGAIVSPQFWIYWAISIPLTIIVTIIWLL